MFAFNFNLRRYSKEAVLGRAVQVDPIKPMLKASGINRFKLKHGFQVLLSNSTCASTAGAGRGGAQPGHGAGLSRQGSHSSTFRLVVSAVCGMGVHFGVAHWVFRSQQGGLWAV